MGFARLLFVAGIALALAGCLGAPRVAVLEPTSVEPPRPSIPPPVASASIFANTATFRPMFEDRRARGVGDTIVIRIEERINASQSTSSTIQRSGSAALEVPTVTRVPLIGGLAGVGLAGSSSNQHQSSGATAASNVLTGTIAVTVVDVLQNGNLVVSGEKQIGTNRELESVRLSGVINPSSIQPGNTVSSTQVADARIEYRGQGAGAAANTVGWLTRIFFSVLPL